MNNNLRLSTHIQLVKQQEFDLLEDILLLEASSLFDPDYYLKKYSLENANVDPYYHYCMYGWRDGLEPSAEFSCEAYAQLYPAVRGVMSPLVHYLRYGKKDNYLTVNPSVCSNVALEIQRLQQLKNAPAADVKPAELPEIRIADHFNQEFRDLQPIPFFCNSSADFPRRLVFVTDALGKSLLGGVGTALILASQYAVKNNRELLIVTRQEMPDSKAYFDFMELMQEATPSKVGFYSDCDRSVSGDKDYKLEISPADEFFTTSWWSTCAVKNMGLTNRIFYIVQEVETFFYPYSDMHLFCSQMMNCKDVCYIINSHYLKDYFSKNFPNVCQNGVAFDPAFPAHLYSCDRQERKKKKLFFYCRKTHPRNLYWTGLETLDKAVSGGMFPADEWDIFFAGSDAQVRLQFTNGQKPIYLGQMSWGEYAMFLSSVDLTFSLMYTPHPSYPPLDAIASGGVCVTNSFDNKQDNPWCRNLIFSGLEEAELIQALEKGKALALDTAARRANFESSTLPSSWKEQFKDVISFMEK